MSLQHLEHIILFAKSDNPSLPYLSYGFVYHLWLLELLHRELGVHLEGSEEPMKDLRKGCLMSFHENQFVPPNSETSTSLLYMTALTYSYYPHSITKHCPSCLQFLPPSTGDYKSKWGTALPYSKLLQELPLHQDKIKHPWARRALFQGLSARFPLI